MIAEPGLPDPHNEFKLADANALAIPKNLPPEPAEATEGVRLLKHTAEGPPREDLIDHVSARHQSRRARGRRLERRRHSIDRRFSHGTCSSIVTAMSTHSS